jgi:SPP1 gp7 family putative phage head morphogenesis protein
MTSKQLAKLIREFLIATEMRSALRLLIEFEWIRKDLAAFFLEKGVKPESIDDVLAESETLIMRRSVRLVKIVSDAQRLVIKKTAKVLNAHLNTAIFQPDAEALEKLIGRSQNGGSLTTLFHNLREPVREKAKEALLEGFEKGLGAREIASKLHNASDIGFGRALTISRTETNEVYRAASREMYKGAGIGRYVWMANLDPRTCIICWRLHGTVWDTPVKVFGHANCRCTMVPLDPRESIATGTERFDSLEPGFQKQILGPKRYELFKSGAGLDSFVGSQQTREFGLKHFIRPLIDL